MIPIPIHRSTGVLRRWLVLVSSLTLGATIAAAADVYVLPNGTGTGTGSYANALSATQLQTAIDALQPGETIHVGSGNYTQNMLTISGSGTAALPKRIIGESYGGGGLPVFTGNNVFANSVTNPKTNPSNYLFRITSTAGTVAYWEFKNFTAKNHGFAFTMDPTGFSYSLRSHLTFENITMDTVEDGLRLYNTEYILVKNCSAIRYSKKGFRFADYSRFVVFDGCSADSIGPAGDSVIPRSIPCGFCGDDTGGNAIIYDIRLVNCISIRNGYPQNDGDVYWNGDGFSTERGTHDVTYTRCEAYDNNDGGFDNKAVSVIFDNCISSRNKKSWRVWSDQLLINCIGAYSRKAANKLPGGGTGGGNSNAEGVQIDPAGFALVEGGTFHNADNLQMDVGDGGYGLQAYNAILSIDGKGPSTGGLLIPNPSPLLALVDSYQSNKGTPDADPVIPAVRTWENSQSVTAFNSTVVPVGKGYLGQGTASTLPTAPGYLVASIDPTSPRRIELNWTDKSTNERDFLVERSTDNVNFSQIGFTGTNATVFKDFGLTPSTTYYYRVRATNSVGNSAASNTASAATPATTIPAAPAGVTVETYFGTKDGKPNNTPRGGILKWTDLSNNEDRFLIERSTDNVTFTQIATQDESSPVYSDLTTVPGTIYYYRVRAMNSAGNSGYSSTAKYVTPVYYLLDNDDPAGITIVGAWGLTTPGSNSDNICYEANYQTALTGTVGWSVTYTPNIVTAGTYDVFAWWPGGDNRATNTPFDINRAGGTTTLSVNQEPNQQIWHPLGTYTFNAGTGGNVKIRTDGANEFTIADAVLFKSVTTLPTPPSGLTATTVNASQINLSWTDHSNIENSYVIEYSWGGFPFLRLASVNGVSGTGTRTYSCTNLAGGTTYTFRVVANGGDGFTVPSPTASATTQNTIILDNADPFYGITVNGPWIPATLTSGFYGTNYLHDNNARGGMSVRFTPVIPETASYQVYARWTSGGNRATNARYDIVHASGTATSYQNQQNSGGLWVSLGTYTFNAGSAGSVLLRDDGCNNYVIADAVMFVRVP